jgi:hypothetical protein
VLRVPVRTNLMQLEFQTTSFDKKFFAPEVLAQGSVT